MGIRMIHIFIINPVAGLKDRSESIRQFLERKQDFSYLVFDTEDAGHEADIVARMLKLFDDEKIRFYICGGSGTFANAISGIEEKDLARVEMAHYPCGLKNDFLKNFGERQKLFYNMDNLIRGEVIQVDFVKNICAVDKDIHNYVLFSVTGLIELIERFASRIRLIGSMNSGLLYVLSFLFTFLFNPTVDYTLEIDGEDQSGEYDMIYIGNSICLGGSVCPMSNASPCDGRIELLLLRKIKKWHAIHLIKLFRRGEIGVLPDQFLTIRKASSLSVKRKDGKYIYLNVDGEVLKEKEWKIELMPGALNYVVPQGITCGFVDAD